MQGENEFPRMQKKLKLLENNTTCLFLFRYLIQKYTKKRIQITLISKLILIASHYLIVRT